MINKIQEQPETQELQATPRANRLHIALFGKRNSGKSSLINALTGQKTALVSPVAGTTTDPVYKAMELHPIGPVSFIDTAGFDDEGDLGQLRIEKTAEVLKKTDIALLAIPCSERLDAESERLYEQWIGDIQAKKNPLLVVFTQSDLCQEPDAAMRAFVEKKAKAAASVVTSTITGTGIQDLKDAIVRAVPEDFSAQRITGGLLKGGETVLLVMPQDIQAPKGRLILPQVQVLRELLDLGCIAVSTTLATLSSALAALAKSPDLIITDSQCFMQVYQQKPEKSLLTSFSVLFAAHKGDIQVFVAGVKALEKLHEGSRILIAEACTHAPLTEDIGRVKIPALLKKRFGSGLQIDFVAGTDFPKQLEGYDLIIHCGACMFNRSYVLSRIDQAQKQGVNMTNYGVILAALSGILDKVVW